MAIDPTLAALIAKFEPIIRDAFLAAIQGIRDAIVLRQIAEHLDRGDVDAAIRAMQIDPAAFGKFEIAIQDAYNGGGLALVDTLPKVTDPQGNRVIWRFAVRDTTGEAEIRAHSAQLVTNAVAEQQQIIRTALTEGLSAGQNPTQTALNVIGRVNRVTGQREGGVIGLSGPQAAYLKNAKIELNGTDPEGLRNYLARARRDKRYDATVRNAIETGKPIPQATIEKMLTGYSNKLLKLRGDAVGLNETMGAMSKARIDAMQQQIDAGKVEAGQITKIWHHSPEEHPREQHIAMDGTSVKFGQKFILPDGTPMDGPHDTEGGPGQTLFCKCYLEIRVSRLDQLLARHRAA